MRKVQRQTAICETLNSQRNIKMTNQIYYALKDEKMLKKIHKFWKE